MYQPPQAIFWFHESRECPLLLYHTYFRLPAPLKHHFQKRDERSVAEEFQSLTMISGYSHDMHLRKHSLRRTSRVEGNKSCSDEGSRSAQRKRESVEKKRLQRMNRSEEEREIARAKDRKSKKNKRAKLSAEALELTRKRERENKRRERERTSIAKKNLTRHNDRLRQRHRRGKLKNDMRQNGMPEADQHNVPGITNQLDRSSIPSDCSVAPLDIFVDEYDSCYSPVFSTENDVSMEHVNMTLLHQELETRPPTGIMDDNCINALAAVHPLHVMFSEEIPPGATTHGPNVSPQFVAADNFPNNAQFLSEFLDENKDREDVPGAENNQCAESLVLEAGVESTHEVGEHFFQGLGEFNFEATGGETIASVGEANSPESTPPNYPIIDSSDYPLDS